MKDDFKTQGMRRKLIYIVREKGITDEHVLDAMMKVPRHLFMDKDFIQHAFSYLTTETEETGYILQTALTTSFLNIQFWAGLQYKIYNPAYIFQGAAYRLKHFLQYPFPDGASCTFCQRALRMVHCFS